MRALALTVAVMLVCCGAGAEEAPRCGEKGQPACAEKPRKPKAPKAPEAPPPRRIAPDIL